MLFLVTGRVQYSAYMRGEEEEQMETRLVDADDVHSARKKFELHWENKSDQYGDHYYVDSVTVHPVIV